MEDTYKTIEEINEELFGKPLSDSQIIEVQNNKIAELQKQIASLQDQLEYQSSMASLFAKKLQEVWNIQDDIIDKINNNSEDNYITIESLVKKLQEVKNIIPAECDKWDKKKSTAYLFEYVSRLMEKGFQILIKQDCTLKNYDYKLDIKQEGLLYIFNFADIDGNEFLVKWEDLI